jgi:hypothetical protein
MSILKTLLRPKRSRPSAPGAKPALDALALAPAGLTRPSGW